MTLPLALTMGEPAGIGGEIAFKAWQRRAEGIPPFYLIDAPERLVKLAQSLGLEIPLRVIDKPERTASVFTDALPVSPLDDTPTAQPGHPEAADQALVLRAIDNAVADVIAGRAAALVTNPINKDALYRAGFRHPGHTEYLAELARSKHPAVMMLASRELRVVPVTIHMALRD